MHTNSIFAQNEARIRKDDSPGLHNIHAKIKKVLPFRILVPPFLFLEE